MNLVISRACDALVKAYFDRPEHLRDVTVTAMDQQDLVCAVLRAVREPTEEMNFEGFVAACRHDNGDSAPSTDIAPATWQAMIDEALK